MTINRSNRMKKLAVGVAMTMVVGGGVSAVLLPTFAGASAASHGADDPAGHLGGGLDDGAGHLRHGNDDAAGHVRNSNDDAAGHVRHSNDDVVGHG
jgi:hypothetical protein